MGHHRQILPFLGCQRSQSCSCPRGGGGGGRKAIPSSFITAITSWGITVKFCPSLDVSVHSHAHVQGGGGGGRKAIPSSFITAITSWGITVKFCPSLDVSVHSHAHVQGGGGGGEEGNTQLLHHCNHIMGHHCQILPFCCQPTRFASSLDVQCSQSCWGGGGGGRKAIPSSFITAITSWGITVKFCPSLDVQCSQSCSCWGGGGGRTARPSSFITAITSWGTTIKFCPSAASKGSD